MEPLQLVDDEERQQPPQNDYDYSDAAPGMQEAVERARRRPRSDASELAMVDELLTSSAGPSDSRPAEKRPASAVPVGHPVFPKPHEAPATPSQRANAASARQRPNAAAETTQAHGPVEPPPPTPEPEADWSGYAPSAPKSPAPAAPTGPKADDDTKALRLKAIRSLSRMLDGVTEPRATISDEAIRSAQARDRQAAQSANLSETIAAAFARRPARIGPVPSEANDLISRRHEAHREELSRRTSSGPLAAALARALNDKPTGGLTEYQKHEIERQDRLDNEAKRNKAAELDPASPQNAAWRDGLEKSGRYAAQIADLKAKGVWDLQTRTTGQDLQNAWEADLNRANAVKAAREGRSATFSHDDERRLDESVEKLSKLLPADYRDFGRKFDEIMAIAQAGKGDIPGVGPLDARKPAWLQSNAGIELQKRAKQLSLAYQHLITGAGASDRERAALEQATADLQDERSFLAGLSTLKDLYDSKVRQVRAGFSPEVISRYDQGVEREFGNAPKSHSALPLDAQKPPKGVIPPNARNVKRVGKGWGYTLPDGTQEVWEP